MLIFLSRFLPLSGIQACIHWDFLSLRHGHNGLWEVPALNQPVQRLTTRLYSDLRLSDTLFSCSSRLELSKREDACFWEVGEKQLSSFLKIPATSVWSGASSMMSTDSNLSLLCPLWWLWPCKAPLCYVRCCVENSQKWWPWWALSFRCSESHHTAGRASSRDPCHVLILCVSALLPLLHLEGLNLPCFSRSGVGNSITIMIFVYLHWFNCLVWVFVHTHTHASVCQCTSVKVRRWLGRRILLFSHVSPRDWTQIVGLGNRIL